MNEFDVRYAHTITNKDRLCHHLHEVSKETFLEIKEQFSKDKKKAKLFEKATKGWAV